MATTTFRATDAPTQFVETAGRQIAFRSIGEGIPIVLCTRFRGNMDLWDPLFLDSLARAGLRVITFDYSGLGLSTGQRNYSAVSLARDAHDLALALNLERIVIAGWSLGGLAAQAFLAMYSDLPSHVVLIGTAPPGPNVKAPEQLFYDTASRPDNSLEDEVVLFFEPRSPASRAAAAQSHERINSRTLDRSPAIPIDFAVSFLGRTPRNPIFPADTVLSALKNATIPVLYVGGDHDIAFPVENWYARHREFPTLQVVTFPQSGHGPQHQYPIAVAESVAAFVKTTGGRRRALKGRLLR